MEEKTICIYGLVDPRDSLIHYVGRTRMSLRSRLSGHKADTILSWDGKARGAGTDKIEWLLSLKAAALSPRVKILEEVTVDEGVEAEKRWVQALFRAGLPLTNQQWRPKTCIDDPSWLRGYATALVELHRLCGRGLSAAVRSTLETSGIALDKFKRAGVDELDMRELEKATNAAPVVRRQGKKAAFPSEHDRAPDRLHLVSVKRRVADKVQ